MRVSDDVNAFDSGSPAEGSGTSRPSGVISLLWWLIWEAGRISGSELSKNRIASINWNLNMYMDRVLINR